MQFFHYESDLESPMKICMYLTWSWDGKQRDLSYEHSGLTFLILYMTWIALEVVEKI